MVKENNNYNNLDITWSKLILFTFIMLSIGYTIGSYYSSNNTETYYVGTTTSVDESVCSYSDENVTITGCSFIDEYFNEKEVTAIEIINLKDEIDNLYTVISELNYDLAFAKSIIETDELCWFKEIAVEMAIE